MLHNCAVENKSLAIDLRASKIPITEGDCELDALHEISRARSVDATMAIVGRPILCVNLRPSPASAIHRAKEQVDHPLFILKLQLYRLVAEKWSQRYPVFSKLSSDASFGSDLA